MKILILGSEQDIHAKHLKQALIQAGCEAYYLNTSLFPQQIRLSWEPNQQQGKIILPEGESLDFSQIKSVFWRNFSGVTIPKFNNPEQERLAYNDSMSTLRTFMQGTNIRWVNSWLAYEFHKEKPLQLSKVQSLGVKIPQTLISNDPDAIIQFAKNHQQVIFKPVYVGAHAKLLEPEHLESDRLNLVLKISPISLQEYIPGTNLRTYVIGKSVYTAEIRSPALDFREDETAEIIPVDLPENIKIQSLEIAQALYLEWTAIDWRLSSTGEYVYLEANPSPMFLHFEDKTGFPLTESLIELLTN